LVFYCSGGLINYECKRDVDPCCERLIWFLELIFPLCPRVFDLFSKCFSWRNFINVLPSVGELSMHWVDETKLPFDSGSELDPEANLYLG
jgi:hypothetical protein